MKHTKWITLLFLWLGLDGCYREPDLMAVRFSVDINGENYQRAELVEPLNTEFIGASTSRRPGCTHEMLWINLSKPVGSKAALVVSFGGPGLAKHYTLTKAATQLDNLCQIDTVLVGITVDIKPESVPTLDIEGLAIYKLVEEPDNYLEITRFDAGKRQVEGRFRLKAVRYGNKSIPIPLADTLVFTNGTFNLGFRRE